MDTFINLMSPVDGLSYPLLPTPSNNSEQLRQPNSQQAVSPRALTKSNSDVYTAILEGPELNRLTFDSWDTSPYFQRRGHASLWRPPSYASLLDSPASSGSAFSSQTCSPWETCPGLAPETPNHNVQQTKSKFSSPFQSPYSHPSEFAIETKGSTQSSFGQASSSSPLLSPIHLPIYPDDIVGSLDLIQHESPDVYGNALGLDMSPVQSAMDEDKESSGLDANVCPPSSTSPSLRDERQRDFFSSDDPHLPRFETPTERTRDSTYEDFNSLYTRVTRRKTQTVNYSEDGYFNDSDEEYVDSDDSSRFDKKLKRTASPEGFASGDEADQRRPALRGRTPGFRGTRGAKSGTGGSKRKTKRRHYCPREGCQSSFTRVTDMERHLASVHRPAETNTNRCTFCHKAFSREDAVLRHENDSCPMRPKKKAERWI